MATKNGTTTEKALCRIDELWTPEFLTRFPGEFDAAFDAVWRAAEPETDDLAHALGSLPLLWTAFWRPLRDGSIGAEHAARWRELRMPPLAGAVESMRRARVVYAEVQSCDRAARSATLVDLWDATVHEVSVPPAMRARLVPWLRCFTVLVEARPGRWWAPSCLLASRAFEALTPAEVIDEAGAAVARVGGKLAATAPQQALLPWCGVAAAAMHRRVTEIERDATWRRRRAPLPRVVSLFGR